MTQSVALILVAVLCFALIPLMPKVIELRIRILRWLKWESLASWFERNRVGFILAGRIIVAAIGLLTLWLGLTGI